MVGRPRKYKARTPHTVLLEDEHLKKLDEIAKKRGHSIQQELHDAVVSHLSVPKTGEIPPLSQWFGDLPPDTPAMPPKVIPKEMMLYFQSCDKATLQRFRDFHQMLVNTADEYLEVIEKGRDHTKYCIRPVWKKR